MLDFQELYESHAAEVYRFARWLAGDQHEAEDITSETFVRAWTRGGAIRTETLRAYLFTIARNVFLGRRRKGRREVALKDVHPDPAPSADRVVASQDQLARVQRELGDLPEIDRTAFVLRVQHELPYAEIARVLEISLAATKVKVHRVRKRLIASLITEEER